MKDNFNNLATEKINSRIKKKSDTNEHLIGDFIDEYQDVGLILKKNKKKISEAVNLFIKTFTNNGSTPKNGKVALPGLVGVHPGNGVNILPPVSVCHHVSTIWHLPLPTTL